MVLITRKDLKSTRQKEIQRAKKADAFVHEEGMQYKLQGFYVDVSANEKGKKRKRKPKKQNKDYRDK